MTLPITPKAEQSDIARAARQPGSLRDILDDLFRNARRTRADFIHVETFDYEGRPTLSVYDDGSGIDDPWPLLGLGASSHDQARARPGAGGMSLTRLAGRRVTLRSGPDETEPGWLLTVPPEAWDGMRPLTIEADSGLCGTNILVEIPDDWRIGLREAVAAAARSQPASVFFHADWVNRT